MTRQKRLAVKQETCHLGILISKAENTAFQMDVMKANKTAVKNINPHQGRLGVGVSKVT